VLGYHPDHYVGQPYELMLTGDPSDELVAELTDSALRQGSGRSTYSMLARHADGHSVVLERTLRAAVAESEAFEAMHEPESNILCFRYVGRRVLKDTQLDSLNRELRVRYNASGAGWITTTLLGERLALRATVMNPRTNAGHVNAVLDGIAGLGRSLERSGQPHS